MFSCTNSRFDADGNPIIDNEMFQDLCIKMEDGNPRWLSPDIILTSSLSVADEARKGENNTVIVRARKACNPAGVELFVSNPSLNPNPTNSVKVFDAVLPTANFVLNPAIDPVRPIAQATQNNWTANESLSDPLLGEGNRLHRCLIARCYPSNLNPPETNFCVVDDPHVAQRNIAIVRVPVAIQSFTFPIQTIGINPEFAEAVTIRAIADRVPNAAVLGAITPSLKQFEGFRQIAPFAPERFALQVPADFSPTFRDNSRLTDLSPIDFRDLPIRDLWRYALEDGVNFDRFKDVVFNPNLVLQEAIDVQKFNPDLSVAILSNKRIGNEQLTTKLKHTAAFEKLIKRATPSFETDLKFPAQKAATFMFTANLPAARSGDANIFHIMHITEKKQVIGGVTVVAVTT